MRFMSILGDMWHEHIEIGNGLDKGLIVELVIMKITGLGQVGWAETTITG